MPDRSGEPRPGRDEPTNLDEPPAQYGPTRNELRHIAIRACNLCDNDGIRNAFPCDHQEHSTPQGRAAARQLLQTALHRDETRDETPTPAPTTPNTP